MRPAEDCYSAATTTADVAVPITLSATDADGDTLTYTIDSVGGAGAPPIACATVGAGVLLVEGRRRRAGASAR